MMQPGLVSISFRGLAPQHIVALAQRAGLRGIEWGGDVHVKSGDLAGARVVAQLTHDAGLQVAAYGSYYRLGLESPEVLPQMLDTALALGAPVVRVWAGRKCASADTPPEVRARIVADARRAAVQAACRNITIATEWHGGTLTDCAASANEFFAAADHPALTTYWQPRERMASEACLCDMDAALPRLVGLHVFHWHEQTAERLTLAEGVVPWERYLAKAASVRARWALLEFFRNDDPDQFFRDAATLRILLARIGQRSLAATTQ